MTTQMNVLVALAVATWAMTAVTAAPLALPATSAALAHQIATTSTPAAAAVHERHGLPTSRSINRETIQRILPKRRPRRILISSGYLNKKYSENASKKMNMFIIANDFREEVTQKPIEKNLRILRADGKQVIFGTSSEVFEPDLKAEQTNSIHSPFFAMSRKSSPDRADVDKDNKVILDALVKQRMSENIPQFFFSQRSSPFKPTSNADDHNQFASEIIFSKKFYPHQHLFEKIKVNHSLKHHIVQLNKAGPEHRLSKRSPLEIGLVQGLGATSHQVTHHGTNAHTSSHHNVVLHPAKAPAHPHVVQISSLHDVTGLVTHAVIDPGLHITSTTVFTHDKPLALATAPHPVVAAAAHAIVAAASLDHQVEHHPPEVEVIPVVPIEHPVVAKAALVLPHAVPAVTHDIFRTHVGGFGVGLDFGGHGAGHGFYATAGFGFR